MALIVPLQIFLNYMNKRILDTNADALVGKYYIESSEGEDKKMAFPYNFPFDFDNIHTIKITFDGQSAGSRWNDGVSFNK